LQGTLPFIAIELLILGVRHRVIHDLESLFYVLLFVCTHLDGPRKIHNPPLFGGKQASSHPSPMKDWISTKDIRSLGFLKSGSMLGFENHVLPFISPYFFPLRSHLVSLWRTLHPITTNPAPADPGAARSFANPIDIINVFRTALQDPILIGLAKNSESNPLKRAFPGEQIFASDTWDVLDPEVTDPHTGKFSKKRRTKCMTRRHRAG
jgi:hypothetical protein